MLWLIYSFRSPQEQEALHYLQGSQVRARSWTQKVQGFQGLKPYSKDIHGGIRGVLPRGTKEVIWAGKHLWAGQSVGMGPVLELLCIMVSPLANSRLSLHMHFLFHLFMICIENIIPLQFLQHVSSVFVASKVFQRSLNVPFVGATLTLFALELRASIALC